MPQENSKTPEQLQYEGLTSLFKTYASYLTQFLGLITGLTIYFTYADKKAMNEERTAINKEYIATVKELKEEIKAFNTYSKVTIQEIKKDAQDELSRVNVNTNRVALDETKKELSYIFGTEKIQNLIKDEAVKQVGKEVGTMVDAKTKNFYPIMDASAQMRGGSYEGLEKLKSFMNNSINENERKAAINLYQQICLEYKVKGLHETTNSSLETQYKVDLLIKKYPETIMPTTTSVIINDARFQNITDAELISFIVASLNDKKHNLSDITNYILTLSKLTKQQFKPFEIEEINDWYRRNK